VLPKGILAQVGEQCYDLEELDLKQCSGHEMLDVESFAALCDGCRQLKTMDLVVLPASPPCTCRCAFAAPRVLLSRRAPRALGLACCAASLRSWR
jgi:hypothetical protein